MVEKEMQEYLLLKRKQDVYLKQYLKIKKLLKKNLKKAKKQKSPKNTES